MTTGGIVSAAVTTLTEGVLRTMFWTKLKLAAVVLLLITAGSAAPIGQATAQKPNPDPKPLERPGIVTDPAATPKGVDDSAPRDDELDVVLLERAWVDAIPRRDAAIVNRIMADDFAGIDPVGNIFTKATYMPDLRNGVFTNQPIELDEIKVRLFGETAVVTSRIKVAGYPTHGRMTNIYVKRRGRWQCVASHASGMAGTTQPQPVPSTTTLRDLGRGAVRTDQIPPSALAAHDFRTPFRCVVQEIYVKDGQTVKKGDPLVSVFSEDLADAKSRYVTARTVWAHDKKILDYKAPLAESNTLPKKEWIEIENLEAQSRLKLRFARDKLLLYGLTDREIEDIDKEDPGRSFQRTFRSPVDDMVIRVLARLGFGYNTNDILIEIGSTSHPANTP
jgi:ketosteroid isomerase-like protein